MDPLERARQLFLEALARHEQRDYAAAEAAYRQALELAPGRPSVMNNLAAVCVEQGKIEEARQVSERVLTTNPDDEIALLNLGGCLAKLGSPAQALITYDRLLRMNPGHVHAHTNRGHALLALGQQREALAGYDAALAIEPGQVDTLFGRGNALMELGQAQEALASYDRALAIDPGHADALYNRGNTLMRLARLEEALASYDRALAVRPGLVGALNNRGLILQALNRREALVENYNRLVAADPDFPYARGYFLNAQLDCCIWDDYDESVARIVREVRDGKRSDSPFPFLAISESAADQLKCARISANDEYPAAAVTVWNGERYHHDRIRVAYLSADYHAHAVPFLIAGLIEAHDRTRFDITAISLGANRDDDMRARLRAAFDRFIDVRERSDREVAELLHEMEIDIAVDLQGYTRDCRPGIFAWRGAPIQVNYLGYPGTMGSSYFDYILADRFVVPPDEADYYSERVVWLPDSYQANDSRRLIAEYVPSRAELGLPQDAFVFCCFNNNYKIAPRVFQSWMRLLNRVPGSVLWLLEDNPLAARNLRKEASRQGIAPERLAFAPRIRMDQHLARQRRADLFLDTLPYNAHVTASDALWAGLPVLTHASGTFAGRVASSLLNAVGLPELVTRSYEEYEATALRLASNAPELAAIRASLARNRATCPLFDTDRIRRHVEAAYSTMWERHQRGERPVGFEVRPSQTASGAVQRRIAPLQALRDEPQPRSPVDSETGFQQAVTFHQGGQLDQAERLYREILNQFPDNFDALHLLGVIESQRGNAAAAVELIGRALAAKPDDAPAHSNIGNAQLALNRPQEALASYDRALALNSEYAEALSNRGNALLQLGRPEEALASCDLAIGLRPDSVQALNNRGNALLQLDRLEEALASYDRALTLHPGYTEALYNQGNTLLKLKRAEEALVSYDRALALKPDYAKALSNRGNALLQLRRPEEALTSCDRAIGFQPDSAEALNNRGLALQQLDRLEEALASYDRVLAASPDNLDALGNRSGVLMELARYEDAAKSFSRLLELAPDDDEARAFLVYSQLHCCDWLACEETVERIVATPSTGAKTPFPFVSYVLKDSAELQYRCARAYARNKYPASPHPVWQGERYTHDRIRLAYVSNDFRNHVLAHQVASLIEHHDRTRFETTAFSLCPKAPGTVQDRLRSTFERFVDVNDWSDSRVARLARDLEIDILVDLTGHTKGGRMGLFGQRPAPIQVNFNCPGTTGADYFDYIVADRIVTPPEHQPYFTEKLVYLPETFQTNDSKRSVAASTPSRREAGLPEEGFVFCSFNSSYKFRPPVFDSWMRLLRNVEGSVLWFSGTDPIAIRNLRREAGVRGVNPERLIFAPRIENAEDYLARQRLADLFLDTLPYNAQTTASDALWVGLPVLTCLGGAFSGRVAASVLSAIGLPDLITHSLEEYEALALKLARDRGMLAGIRERLARNRATYPLFDTDRFRRHIESAYITMWERYQRGEPPAPFAVPAIS